MRYFLSGIPVHRAWLVLAFLFITLAVGLPSARAADVLLVVGDSLSAGYGVSRAQAWPSLLQERLDDEGLDVRVVNASISGETSSSGRARLPSLLERHRPRWVVIELGANDGLRGLSLEALRANLYAMRAQVEAADALPILAGMHIPPNYGSIYTSQFAAIYAELGQEIVTIPFLLDGVAGDPELNQPDGVHPTAEGHRQVLENVWAVLAPVLGVGVQVEGEKKTMLDSPK